MALTIQRESDDFLYQQVINMIREMEVCGTLSPGDKLPSLRNLSEKLSVSIPTVRQAYSELEKQDVIEARPKSGYFLKNAINQIKAPKRARLAKRPITVRRQSLIEEVFEAINKPDIVPLGIANPALVHSSDKALARIMRHVLRQAGSKVVAYGPIRGHEPLKKQIALSYLEYGLQVNPDEILITNGAQEAIAIALKTVAKAGDVIAVESPCYFGILELIESLDMMALEIPVCPEEGIWLDDLEKGIEDHDVAACIFASSISNPIGSFMPDEKRQALVELLESYDIPLIEDDVYGELYFTDKRGTPAQLYAKKGLVITCASFSKTVAPGYRIGWLVSNKYMTAAFSIKRALSCSSSLLSQWTLSEFIASGEYQRNLRHLRQVLQAHKDRMIALVNDAFPKSTRVSDPKGAGVLWLELPANNDSAELFYAALDKGISIAPGSIFSASNKFKRYIRISYGLPWSNELEDAVRTLATLCKSEI